MVYTGKKRERQQQSIVRKVKKNGAQVEPKRRRTSYFQNHLFIFKIDPKMLFRTYSKSMTDCVICTLEFLKIINDQQAHYLRTQVEKGGGVQNSMIPDILNHVLNYRFKNIAMEAVAFDSVYQIGDVLQPSTATIVIFDVPKTGQIGHMCILAKDKHGIPGLIDPQQRLALTGIELERYVDTQWDRRLLIFTHG